MSDPERDDTRAREVMHALLGWLVAVGFGVLWLMGGCR